MPTGRVSLVSGSVILGDVEARNPSPVLRTWDLQIPSRKFRATLDRPELLYVAWHNAAKGVCELLDGEGRGLYGRPQERFWTVVTYERVERWETGARYEEKAE